MIQFFDGILNASTHLTTPLALTPQDQAALAQSINNGTCLLRVKTNAINGAPSFRIDGIEISFYDPWSGESTSGITYIAKSFSSSTIVNAGDTEYAMQDLSGLKELAVYPTILRLKVSDVTLDANNNFDGCTIGIVMSSAVR